MGTARSPFIIRAETPDDLQRVLFVNQAAFGGDAEANLVIRLHADGDVLFGLVAEVEGDVVGHTLFSRLPIDLENGEAIVAAALAPLAVLPAWQRRGIGTALVRAGLERSREQRVPAVVVLGDPAFYTRFGFRVETASGLQAPWSGPNLMAIALATGSLGDGRGRARYAAAFSPHEG